MSKPTIDELREQVRAPVITADDPGYEQARQVHNGTFDRHPEVVVRAEQVADVIAAVNFARDTGNYQRLVEVERTYDLFHLNQNFKP